MLVGPSAAMKDLGEGITGRAEAALLPSVAPIERFGLLSEDTVGLRLGDTYFPALH